MLRRNIIRFGTAALIVLLTAAVAGARIAGGQRTSLAPTTKALTQTRHPHNPSNASNDETTSDETSSDETSSGEQGDTEQAQSDRSSEVQLG